jgi:hypothetical protein
MLRGPRSSAIQTLAQGDVSAAALAMFDDLWRDKLGKRFQEADIMHNLATIAPNSISRAIFHTDR